MLVKETDRWIAPTYLRQDIALPSGKISVFCGGKAGWFASSQGSGPLTGGQLKQVQGNLFRLYFRLLLSDRIEGRSVNALDDNTIEIADAAGQTARLEFDTETQMPQRVLYEMARTGGPPITAEETWSDFQEIAGVKVPHKITVIEGGRKYAEMKVTDFKVNSGIRLAEIEKRP
jgi:hypothetical protein